MNWFAPVVSPPGQAVIVNVYWCFSYLFVISTCKMSLFNGIYAAVAGGTTYKVWYPRKPLSTLIVVETYGYGEKMDLY